ncbi:NADPH-dependent FMN reductase [Bacillus sp. MUM 13]|uniref:NADPH-dependent FMN reductase n=1 Tax=Bacillus sp. MUM 13 TaxID=1678001 RepID=UPI0008F5DA10|nr:NADPH-dependent FMN reductase [Bacillus sp. MUM 13]OIK12686.1 FMN reductase (NADPH) [Bacillus sp. MUM 13]
MSQIVIISGSPSAPSRTDLILKHVQSLEEKNGFTSEYVSVRDFSADILVNARYDSPEIEKLSQAILNADGVIIGSPVYKASYTGVLKSLIDLLPEGAFKNKPVLPIMVGGSMAHLLAIDYSLKPLIAILKGQPIQGLYFIDKQIDKTDENMPLKDEELIERLNNQLEQFEEAVHKEKHFRNR